jgi:hypothetical protein
MEEDADFWRNYLKRKGVRFAFFGQSRTLYGRVYIFHPRKSLDSVAREGTPVVPLEEVVDFCLGKEIAYEPALEYLDEKFQIDYPRRETLES